MSRRLSDNITSNYLAAAQQLRSHGARKKIVAYVESYDDVLFWRNVLSEYENEERYFEVMLPSRNTLSKGKKVALMNALGERFGRYMIACVDADYDYLLQGSSEISRRICESPYVMHTYTYAIENYQCYAPCLHDVCVMATLNDHDLFSFTAFMADFSRIVHPLFVWSIWCYRYGTHGIFTMADLCLIVTIEDINLYHPEQTLEKLRHYVNRKINYLQNRLPQAKETYKPLMQELEDLGVLPEDTYLFMRGHDIYDKVVTPLFVTVCEALHREREREIHKLAEHNIQMQNELSGYQHSSSAPEEMLRKHALYRSAPLYGRIKKDVEYFLSLTNSTSNAPQPV
ncbi:MAG: DUF4435 domain-containing protein [Bacteroidaceae bacterium]